MATTTTSPGPHGGHHLPDPTRRVTLPEHVNPVLVFGAHDEILRTIERAFPQLRVVARGSSISLWGEEAEAALAQSLLSELVELAAKGRPLDAEGVAQAVAMLRQSEREPAELLSGDVLSIRGRTIRPKTMGQKAYVEAIEASTIVFGIGPAGTGKTFLAMAAAVEQLLSGAKKRIILTRPAVEAGESLGFLPGSLSDKIDPYLRPLYDALHEMLEPEALPKLLAAGTIEVAPLAYMRGRTLNDAFIILDEAQNTTPKQMKMFLTRLGFNSQVVVTGDISQVDLPTGQRSGLAVVAEILTGINDISFCYLTSADVVRHQLVSEIIDAYDRWDARFQGLAANRTRSGKEAHPSANRRRQHS